MEMHRVDTPLISGIGYHGPLLRVSLRGRGTYEFQGIPPTVAQAFMDSVDKDAYFDRFIRGSYWSIQVGG